MPPDFTSDLNMGAPWAELSGIGGPPDQAEQTPPELQKNLDSMRNFGAQSAVAAKASSAPSPPDKISISTDPTGKKMVKVETSLENYEGTTRSAMNWHQALGGMAKQMEMQDQRLAQQEQQIRNQPAWVQLATALSANLAQQKDMPGWVQGLGKTAAQLNPQPEQIAAQRMALLGPRTQLAEKGYGLSLHEQQIEEQGAQRKAAAVLTAEKARKDAVEHALDNATQSIKAGTGDVDAAAMLKSVALAGATPDEIRTAEATLGSLAANIGKKFTLERADRIEAQRLSRESEDRRGKVANAALGVMATKAKEKSLEEKGIEAIAQSLAKGELTSIRDVASMRGGQRSLIFGRAKELNPQFNTGEINRKIKMEDSFTNGKDGQSLQSFDTFLQHAGEVTDALKKIQLTDSPLLNKSWNWWRKNMKGTPELARLETSLEPVAMEFEKFLTNQQQVLKGDKERIDRILDPKQPMNVILATTNQMAKTAQDRFVAMNHRYKRVIGADIEFAFSDAAITGAAKNGIDLGSAATTSGPTAGARDSGGLHPKVTPQAAQDGVAAAKSAKVGSTVTIMGKTYKKRGENDFVEVK